MRMNKSIEENAFEVSSSDVFECGEIAADKGIARDVEQDLVVHIQSRITGFTAHGARPHLGVNAVDAACLAASSIHMIPVLSKGKSSVRVLTIDAGNSSINMIPDQVEMTIEVRSYDNSQLNHLTEKIIHAVDCAAGAVSAKAVSVVCRERTRE